MKTRTFSRQESPVKAPATVTPDSMPLHERPVDGEAESRRPRILEKLELARARFELRHAQDSKDSSLIVDDPMIESSKIIVLNEAKHRRAAEYAKQQSLNRRERELALSLLCEMSAMGMRVTNITPWARQLVASAKMIQRAYRMRLERRKLQKMRDLINDEAEILMIKAEGWSGWQVKHDKFAITSEAASNCSTSDHMSSGVRGTSKKVPFSDAFSRSTSCYYESEDHLRSDAHDPHQSLRMKEERKLKSQLQSQDKGSSRRMQALDQGKDVVSSSSAAFDSHSSRQASMHWDLIRKDLRHACRAIGLSHEFIEEECNEEIGGMASIFRFSLKLGVREGTESSNDDGAAEAGETEHDASGKRQRTAAQSGTFSIQLVSYSSTAGSSGDSPSRHPTMGYTVVKGSGTVGSSDHFKLFSDAAAAEASMVNLSSTAGFANPSNDTGETTQQLRSDCQRLVIAANPQTQVGAFSPGRAPLRLRRARMSNSRASDDFCGKESRGESAKKPMMATLDVRDLAQFSSDTAHPSRPQTSLKVAAHPSRPQTSLDVAVSPLKQTGIRRRMTVGNELQAVKSHRNELLATLPGRSTDLRQTDEKPRHGKSDTRRRRTLASESELLGSAHRGLSGPESTAVLHAVGFGSKTSSPLSRGRLSIVDSVRTASTARCQDDEPCRPWMEAAVDEKAKLPPIGQAADPGALWPWLMTPQQRNDPHNWQGCTTSYGWAKEAKVSKGLGPMRKVGHNSALITTPGRRDGAAPLMQGHRGRGKKVEWMPEQMNQTKLYKDCNSSASVGTALNTFADDQQLRPINGSQRQEHNKSSIPESKSSLF